MDKMHKAHLVLFLSADYPNRFVIHPPFSLRIPWAVAVRQYRSQKALKKE